MSSQLSEQNKELYQERLQTQAETNQLISGLIQEAYTDPKKYVPYGPVLMNIYDQQKIDVNRSAMLKQIQDEKKAYCDFLCKKGTEDCVPKCERFFTWATNYGFHHFQTIHKYAYSPTVSEGDQ